MTSDRISPGDLVILKSGGPVMTVAFLRTDNRHIHCEWFDEDVVLQSHTFRPESLKHAADSK